MVLPKQHWCDRRVRGKSTGHHHAATRPTSLRLGQPYGSGSREPYRVESDHTHQFAPMELDDHTSVGDCTTMIHIRRTVLPVLAIVLPGAGCTNPGEGGISTSVVVATGIVSRGGRPAARAYVNANIVSKGPGPCVDPVAVYPFVIRRQFPHFVDGNGFYRETITTIVSPGASICIYIRADYTNEQGVPVDSAIGGGAFHTGKNNPPEDTLRVDLDVP